MTYKDILLAYSGYVASKWNAGCAALLAVLCLGIVIYDTHAYTQFTTNYVEAEAELIAKLDAAPTMQGRRTSVAGTSRARQHVWRYQRNGETVERRFNAGSRAWLRYKVGETRTIWVHRERPKTTRWKARVRHSGAIAGFAFAGLSLLGVAVFTWLASAKHNGRRRFPENGFRLNAAYRIWQAAFGAGLIALCAMLAWNHIAALAKPEEVAQTWGSIVDLRVRETSRSPRFEADYQYLLAGRRIWNTETLAPDVFFQLRRGEPVTVYYDRSRPEQASLSPIGADWRLLKFLLGAAVLGLGWFAWQPFAWHRFVARTQPPLPTPAPDRAANRAGGRAGRMAAQQETDARMKPDPRRSAVARPHAKRPNVIEPVRAAWRFT